jgi:outer membrane protein assembly factor BamD
MDKRILKRSLAASCLAVLSVIWLSGCLLHRHRNVDLPGPVAAGDQPDKILYERAMNEIDRGRYDVGRLTLQTLLNTYPDSEFLAKAKLAIADSYYDEGGMSGLTQAEAEYKDFITFFPTSPEAPEAQFRAGMAHYRLMGKPDRDRTEARLAEAEFKEFLLKFPNSKLLPRVKGRLREVQEVLGQSDFSIAQYYFQRQANRAARSRFQEIADRYPDFSQADSALWYLGQTLERMKNSKDAAVYYSDLITDYPLSPRADDAKARLAALHQLIPHPTRAMLARAQADEVQRAHQQDLLSKVSSVFSSSPDISATRHGPVRVGQKPREPEVARTEGPTSPGNSIVVEPVSDSALNADKPAESKPEGSDPAAKAAPDSPATDKSTEPPDSTGKQTQTVSNKPDSTSSSAVPAKKKSRFHVLKKIVKPF